jgi:hypothetical protein
MSGVPLIADEVSPFTRPLMLKPVNAGLGTLFKRVAFAAVIVATAGATVKACVAEAGA